MKKFAIHLLLFCCMPLPLLFLLNNFVDKGLRKSRYTFYSEWNDIYSGKINADLLIMGSSRAWVHFSPAILDSALGINSYNLGLDGSCFDLQYKRLKIYLQHNKKPKYIVQEVGFINTLQNTNVLPGTVQFLPYLDDTSIWNIVKNGNVKFNFFDRYFPLYKYNNELQVVKEGILSNLGKGAAAEKYKGYQGQTKTWDSSFYEFKKNNLWGWTPTVKQDAIDEFHQYLEFCKSNNIKVIMVYPPIFCESTALLRNKETILNIYKKFSVEFNFPFYNYESDSLTLSRSNFYNSQHLNKHGSEVFSREFANDVRKELH